MEGRVAAGLLARTKGNPPPVTPRKEKGRIVKTPSLTRKHPSLSVVQNLSVSTSFHDAPTFGESSTDDAESGRPDVLRDLITLHPLTEDAVLAALQADFGNGRPYVFAGPTLIAVNPFEPRSEQYTPAVMTRYLEKMSDAPHLFAVAAQAIDRVKSTPQLLLVTGESGAGKSFSARTMLRFLTFRDLAADTGVMSAGGLRRRTASAPPSSTGAVLTRLINGGSEILEAFGNARTRMNHNSSRFGKFVQIEYDADRRISGSRVRTFLLERTRLTSKAPSEGNFHIFYQILGGLPTSTLEELRLTRDPDSYRLLSGQPSAETSDSPSATPHDGNHGTALAWTERTVDALTCIGVTAEERADIIAVLASVLHLGNAVSAAELGAACDAAAALGVDAVALQTRLSERCLRVRGEAMTREATATEFETSRDSLIKLLYVAVFEWLVSRMSYCAAAGTASTPRKRSIDPQAAGPTAASSRYIGLIDIFGFETCNVNSLEQFCINYTNEKVQQHFVRQVLTHHRDEFVREGVEMAHIEVPDNRECLALFEGPCALFKLLDEECLLSRRQGPVAGRLAETYAHHLADRKHFYVPRTASGSFGVKHYCGDTVYSAELFVPKNQERLDPDHLEVLKGSTRPTLAAFLAAATAESSSTDGSGVGGGASGKRQRQQSVVSQFKSSLDSLLGHFSEAQAHYIRCIKPNSAGARGVFDEAKVLDQLRNNGVVETIKISTQNFPRPVAFDAFFELFRAVSSAALERGAEEGAKLEDEDPVGRIRNVCASMLPAARQAAILFGKTKVFLPQECLDALERAEQSRVALAASAIQRCWRRQQAAKRELLARITALRERHSAIKVQRVWRAWKAVQLAKAKAIAEAQLAKAKAREQARAQASASRDIGVTGAPTPSTSGEDAAKQEYAARKARRAARRLAALSRQAAEAVFSSAPSRPLSDAELARSAEGRVWDDGDRTGQPSSSDGEDDRAGTPLQFISVQPLGVSTPLDSHAVPLPAAEPTLTPCASGGASFDHASDTSTSSWFGVSVVPDMLLPILKASVDYEKRGGLPRFTTASAVSRYPLSSLATFRGQKNPVPGAHRLPAPCLAEAALGLRWLLTGPEEP